jgi:hypothetical protein
VFWLLRQADGLLSSQSPSASRFTVGPSGFFMPCAEAKPAPATSAVPAYSPFSETKVRAAPSPVSFDKT